MGRGLSNRSESPIRRHRSPRRRSPSGREKSPAHRRRSPAEHVKFPSSVSRSPSPRTKRLRRAQAEGESQRVSEKDDKKNQKIRSDRDIHKEKDFVKESDDRKERGSRKDAVGNGSKTRNGRSKSPQRHHRSKNESQSPQRHHRSKNESQSPQRHRRPKNESQSPQRHHRSKNESQSPSKRERIPDGRNKERSVRDASGTGTYRSTNRRSTSPSAHHNRTRHQSRSPPSAADNREVRSSRGTEQRNEEDDPLEKMNATQEALETKEKQKPSFELSGKLADETNRVKGVTLLFNEPPDARKPEIRWRLYVFKAGEALNEPLYVHRQTCYLFGRERRVADIPTDHPSCSKQHAVLQYRQVEKEQPDGMLKKQITPYIMDLGSTNGTFINETRIEAQRYYELHEQDTLKFGNSSREYVLLHENSSN